LSFTIAIVGRPNVGKSTLYNRLIGERQAIVDNISGVTRDRQYGESEWNGKAFNVIDTGGFVPNSADVFEVAIKEQVQIAIEEASLILFMVDVTTGITDLDDMMVQMLRRTDKPVFVVVNKVDNRSRMLEANEFYSLGMEHTYFVSSINGSGTGELLDGVAEVIPKQVLVEEEENLMKVAIVGQPNVGKSSLLNAMVGEQRNIVTDIAGTTRDSIYTHYNLFGKDFLLIDTAGIRKKSKVMENLEFYSVIRAINAIDECDVCILMVDAKSAVEVGVEGQDLKILHLAEIKRKGVVLLVNKWDLIENKAEKIKPVIDQIKGRLAPFNDVPILFVSALEKTRVMKTIDTAIEVYKRKDKRIPTSEINDKLQDAIEKTPPPSIKGKYVKIKYITQLDTPYPAFVFFCNLPQYIKEPYKNFLENKIRSIWDFSGVPIRLVFRKK